MSNGRHLGALLDADGNVKAEALINAKDTTARGTADESKSIAQTAQTSVASLAVQKSIDDATFAPKKDPIFEGIVRAPNQPSFQAVHSNSLNQKNIPTNTWTKIQFDKIIFNENGDFNVATSTITASVAGKYMLMAAVVVNGLSKKGPSMYVAIKTSNLEYRSTKAATYQIENLMVTQLVELDENDTATVQIFSYQNRPDVESHTNPIKIDNVFSGYLAC